MFHKYDATKEQCPLPLVKMRMMLKKMHVNDKCSISILDEGSKKDIPKYLIKKGYIFSSHQLDNGTVELVIQNR